MSSTYTSKIDLGFHGQAVALDFFLKQGVELVAANVRQGRGEIDLVLEPEPGIWWCVEVKTRTRVFHLSPKYFLKKRYVMARTLARWIHSHQNHRPREIHFVLAIVMGEKVELFDL